MPSPLIENNTLTAQTASKVPTVTGMMAAISAHRSSRERPACLGVLSRMMPLAKHIAGPTMTMSIHDSGVALQSVWNPLVAQYPQAAASHAAAQTRTAIETADLDTRLRRRLCSVIIHLLDNV
jgi:hypothetical protein